MGTEALTNLISWLAAGLAWWYCAWTWQRYRRRTVGIELAVVTMLAAVAATGFLLRPLAALGMLEDGLRDTVALAIRVAFLIVMGGLVWNLVDHWRDARRT